MNIAIIGCGEVGRCYAEAFAKAGHRIVVLCDERPTDAVYKLAETLDAEVTTSAGEWAKKADVIVSAVFGGVALSAAQRIFPFMQSRAIYADMTTADPQHMQVAVESANASNVRFVDVAIMGAVTATREATPLICAGHGADTIIKLMQSAGAPIKLAGSRPGDAATLKLLRSIFTKGLEALSIECLMTAEKMGLRKELYEVLSDIDQMRLPDFMELSVRTHILHAKRRLKEVQEAKRLMTGNDLNPAVLNGVEELFERTSRALDDAGEIDKSLAGNLNWLSETAQTNTTPVSANHGDRNDD